MPQFAPSAILAAMSEQKEYRHMPVPKAQYDALRAECMRRGLKVVAVAEWMIDAQLEYWATQDNKNHEQRKRKAEGASRGR